MDSSREAFEAWHIGRHGRGALEKSEGGFYVWHDVVMRWDAWQASRKQALEEALVACKGRTIEATEPLSARYLYQSAVADCAHAIRSLEGNVVDKLADMQGSLVDRNGNLQGQGNAKETR